MKSESDNMIQKEIYPKTQRMKVSGDKVYLTEKLDGSNLVLFKKGGELYMAQRNNIFCLSEIEDQKKKLYPGLYQWLQNYGVGLQDNLHEGSCVCGEWLGMGNLKYTIDEFDKRFYMFAKANIDDDFNLYNLIYDHSLFIYPFIDMIVPYYIGIVPEVMELTILPNKKHLDSIYDKYCNQVGRPVEGFVINYKNIITKYVRYKRGKMVEYSDLDHKNIENTSQEEA